MTKNCLPCATCLAERNAGVIETILGRNKIEHFEWYHELAKRTQRPILWQSLQHRWAEPNLWREQLDAVEPIFKGRLSGLRFIAHRAAGAPFHA